MRKLNQSIEILLYLKTGERLTSLEAVRLFGTMRLAARVFDLRKRGHRIDSVTVQRNGKSVSEYFLRR